MANTTWNPSDKSANITLSGSNLIATSSGTQAWVRAIDRQVAGKFYWEITTPTWVNAQSALGAAANVTLSGFAVRTSGVIRSGLVYVDNVSTGINIGALSNGSLVGVAIDCSARLIWYRLGAAGNWNGSGAANPATGAGGITFNSLGGVPVYPTVWMGAASDQATANFGDTAFTGAVPAGFTSGFPAGASITNTTLATQVVLEQFLVTDPPAQVTQVTIEQWVTTATITGQALVTQVALEQWVPAVAGGPTVELAGNLGGISHYGLLKYGLGKYSQIPAFALLFSANVTVTPALNLSGDLAPVIVLAADLDVHVNLIDLVGGIAPQIALEGALSLDLPLSVLEGGLTPIVVLGASEFVSGPLWASSEPCPAPPWADSEICPPPMWTPIGPCDPVEWKRSELCNG